MIKVLAFGTFDGLHEGHVDFLRQAKREGDALIVAVAHDAATAAIKGAPPRHPLAQRLAMVQEAGIADAVVAGDAVTGSWEVLARERPDVIALGYDQDGLRRALEDHCARNKAPIKLRVMKPFQPERYHNRILRPRDKEA